MDNQVEEIKSKIDIVALISETVPLKKAGRNYKGLCPFHGEKTPSFMVNPERQIFKCFGCGEGGDALSFVEKSERVSFPEALEMLASRVGVKLKKTAPNPAEKQKEVIFKANSVAAELFNFVLTKHSAGKKAAAYLKARGVTAASIKDFGLGYAPNQEDFVVKFLAKKGFEARDLVVAGLILPSQRGKGFYDRFRDRIVFPIRDTQARVVGFSARALGDIEPKYLNSPDTPVFNKSNALFGIDLARSEISKSKTTVLVEGNLDVISSHQIGVRNTVAPLGTALTEAQVGVIRRFAESIVLALDTDSAGVAASKRAIELAENQGLGVKVADLRKYKDPDEMIASSPTEWKKTLEDAIPVYDFIVETSLKRWSGTGAEGKRKVVAEIAPYLTRIEDPIMREHYFDQLASRLAVSLETLRTMFAPAAKGAKSVAAEEEKSSDSSLEEYFLSLLLAAEKIPETIVEEVFQKAACRDVFRILKKEFEKENKLRAKTIAGKIPEALSETFDSVLLQDIDESLLAKAEVLDKEIHSVLTRMRRLKLQKQLQSLNLMIKQAEASQEKDKATNLANQFRDLSLQLAGLDLEV